jgi:hypothetical protein
MQNISLFRNPMYDWDKIEPDEGVFGEGQARGKRPSGDSGKSSKPLAGCAKGSTHRGAIGAAITLSGIRKNVSYQSLGLTVRNITSKIENLSLTNLNYFFLVRPDKYSTIHFIP